MKYERKDVAPFGWAVGCLGRKPGQVRDEVRRNVDWARGIWQSSFPEDEGYEVRVESPAGAGHGVRLSVQRGDFRAAAAIEQGLARDFRSGDLGPQLRMFGRGGSTVVARAEHVAARFVVRGRAAGSVVGLLASLAMLPLLGTLGQGMVIVGAMFIAVVMLATTIVGGGIGAWIGDQIADAAMHRARQGANTDSALQRDLERWKALSRRLHARRVALKDGSVAGQPFRALRES